MPTGKAVPKLKPRLGDILAFRVTHTAKVIRVSIRMAKLTRSNGPHSYTFPIKTPGGENLVFLSAGPGGNRVPKGHPWSGGSALLYRGTIYPVVAGNSPDTPSNCAVRHTIDYKKNRVAIAFPPACLANPTWVRAGGTMTTQANSDVRTYSDTALVRGRPGTVAYSPRTYSTASH